MRRGLLVAAIAAGVSAASFAAPLYVPNRDGRWPGPGAPFADSRSIQHDALAAGLDGVPGRPRTIADGLYFVAAPPPARLVGTVRDKATAEAVRAAGFRMAAGGVTALWRIAGSTIDVGDILGSRSYHATDMATDLAALPHLDTEGLDLVHVPSATNGVARRAWPGAPAILGGVTALLAATALIILGAIFARRPARPQRGFHPLPTPVKALPPVRRHRRPMRARPPGGDDNGPVNARRGGRTRLGR